MNDRVTAKKPRQLIDYSCTAVCLLLLIALQGVFLKAESSLLGLGESEGSKIVIHDLRLVPDDPVVPGEEFLLSTVGAEHRSEEGTVFHPLVSVLIDHSFSEDPRGQWLALWTLGSKTPNIGDRLVAIFPGLLNVKESREGALRKLRRKLEKIEENPERASGFPDPLLKVTEGKYRANEHLILTGLKRSMGALANFWFNTDPATFAANVLYRNYLLRHNDLREHQFQHAYLGLLWYSDLAEFSPEPEALSAEAVYDLKLRLLASRHLFGRWVREEDGPDFVHGYESQMRDHLWGTSCYLASAANLYHLGYQEFQRYTAGGVPIALGGILYYDPELAPDLSQVRWGAFNPFDLTYNPFEDPYVKQAAEREGKVPLAIYAYQSNMALKPIIAVDFFRPDNPRLRQAATYWHKLGDQTLAVSGYQNLPYWLANKGGSFLANRKGLSAFSDKKNSLGLEELRLSLLSHLYFDEQSGDQLADAMDRLLINPLSQTSRAQALRARIQYRRLAREEPLVELGRELRSRWIKKVTTEKGNGEKESIAAYRRYLARREDLRVLKVFLDDEHLPSVPVERIDRAFADLHRLAVDPDPDSVETLMDLRLQLQERPLEAIDGSSGWLEEVDGVLARFYEADGRNEQDLDLDLQMRAEERRERAEKEMESFRKEQVDEFKNLARRYMRVLRGFVDSDGDLMTVSPWYLNESLAFFSRTPLILETYPEIEPQYRKREQEILYYVSRTRDFLKSNSTQEKTVWLEEEKESCLQVASEATRELEQLALTQVAPSLTGSAAGDAPGIGDSLNK